MLGLNTHEPLRRMQHQREYSPLPNDLVSEETQCLMSPPDNAMILPLTFVSLPSLEEGHVSLRQQTSICAMANEDQATGNKNWHHKAIRRNLSKTKELVLFVGGLKCSLPSAQYVSYGTDCANTGCFFVTFMSGTSAAAAYKNFQDKPFHETLPHLQFLPYISVPRTTDVDSYEPLLVFINCKSGGGQGNQLRGLMLETLNSSQVFLMEKSGALPGLFAFRKLPRFRILVCGGDGTVGWVLSHLEEVQRHLHCPSPPVAILPVGTGNDLARVLGFGSGWSGENVDGLLAQVQESEPVQLDRWNVMFDSKIDDKLSSPDPLLLSDAVSFADDDMGGREAPLSPINIVMSVGGINPPLKRTTLNHKDGVRNLVTVGLPMVSHQNPMKPDSDPGDSRGQFLSNNYCDNMDSTQANHSPWVKRVTDPDPDLTSEAGDSGMMSGIVMQQMDNDNKSKGDVVPTDPGGSPKLVRHRSRNSRRHRMVQILSGSDLEFGQFIGCEEDQTDANNTGSDTLRRKASLLKLVDDNDGVDSARSSPTGADSISEPSKDSVFVPDPGAVHDGFIPELSHQRVASDSSLMRQSKDVAFHKTLSLPLNPVVDVEDKFSLPGPADDVKLLVMSNYFGIGIDAELSLAFHLAREENPERCTSRLRNKALYFKAGLKKMTSRSMNLNHVLELEVNNEVVSLPSVRGLIFLNIGSWGGGANTWGSTASKRFGPPSFGDGMLEVIGVSGVAHMSQMYSGLRTGIRIAQGEYIRISLKAEVAVQIDGEPWMQPPGKIVISVSPQQATMLKRHKKKSK